MFKIVPNPTFAAKVLVHIPGSDTPGVLDVVYRHKGQQALSDWWAAAKDKPVAAAVQEIVANVSGLHDESGAPIAWSEAACIQFLDQYHTAGGAIVDGYFEELNRARAKN